MFEAFYPGEELDLATIERHAYADGDIRTAQLAAMALDAQREAEEINEWVREEVNDALAEKDEAIADYDRCQEAWGEHNAAMRAQLEELRQAIEVAARVSDRELILGRIGECLALIDKAEG